MPAPLPEAPKQLMLFDDPAASAPLMCARRRRRPLRLPVSLLAIGLATAGMVSGSFAAWTAQSSNPGSAVTAGTLTMTNSRNATSLFSAANVKPGDTGSSTVTVENTGSIPMSVALTQDQLTATGIEDSLGLKVHDITRNWCYWPVSQPGACPAAFGSWDARATLVSLPVAAGDGTSAWLAGEAHTFTISWQLSASSPNSDQGKTGSFRLVWDGSQ